VAVIADEVFTLVGDVLSEFGQEVEREEKQTGYFSHCGIAAAFSLLR
jgi:hypothetical protein